MTSYLLVHGGNQDGSVWNGVRKYLTKTGNTVINPSMTPINQTTLNHNIEEIAFIIQKSNLQDIILVGHSYGSMVISGIADKCFEKIACLVYIDSAVPKSGDSLYSIFSQNDTNAQDFGLETYKPCTEALTFNETKLASLKKVYIHCLQSQFLRATQSIYKKVIDKAPSDNWIYFDLDTDHNCMISQPKQLSIILGGLPIVL